MKNVTKILLAAFVIGVFCAINLSAQENKKPAVSNKGIVIANPDQKLSKRSEAENNLNAQETTKPVIFCWTSDENTAASYRLKVWQLKQGQTVETAMKTNKPVVIKTDTPVNNKHPELMRTTESNPVNAANSEAIKACSESLPPEETSPAANVQKTKTKSNAANERQTVTEPFIVPINVDNFPACTVGASCDYVFTVEALNADGNPLNPNAMVIPVKFGWNVKTNK